MHKSVVVAAWLGLASVPTSPSPYFEGSIAYETEYQTLAGETLFYAVKPKSWFYVQGSNLKLYDRNKKLQELYRGETNEFYRFENGRPITGTSLDRPSGGTTKCLSATATILGYPCQALQLVQEGVSTLVFYSDALRVNTAAFSRCPSPGWYALLQATDGALPLRTITVDTRHDVTITTEALAVQAMPLVASDFTTTAPAR